MSAQQPHAILRNNPTTFDNQCYNVVSERVANCSLLNAAIENAAMSNFQPVHSALDTTSATSALAAFSLEGDLLTGSSSLMSDTDYTLHDLGTSVLPAEEKITHIMDYARSIGYEDFDSLATEYYTTKFPISSNASTLQRTSRSRNLRGFLDKLHQSTQSWHEYEVHDYQNEVLKAAEGICRVEQDKYIDKVRMQEVLHDYETGKLSDYVEGSELEYRMLIEKLKLQNEVSAWNIFYTSENEMD